LRWKTGLDAENGAFLIVWSLFSLQLERQKRHVTAVGVLGTRQCGDDRSVFERCGIFRFLVFGDSAQSEGEHAGCVHRSFFFLLLLFLIFRNQKIGGGPKTVVVETEAKEPEQPLFQFPTSTTFLFCESILVLKKSSWKSLICMI